jgi:hypothetical protein
MTFYQWLTDPLSEILNQLGAGGTSPRKWHLLALALLSSLESVLSPHARARLQEVQLMEEDCHLVKSRFRLSLVDLALHPELLPLNKTFHSLDWGDLHGGGLELVSMALWRAQRHGVDLEGSTFLLRDLLGSTPESHHLTWSWFGPLPAPLTFREPSVSQWKAQGYLRPSWAQSLPLWRQALDLASTSFCQPTPDALGVLADCLEECGCEDPLLLDHLRGHDPCYCALSSLVGMETSTGRIMVQDRSGFIAPAHGNEELCGGQGYLNVPQHVRGCWALDLLLSRD